MDALRHTSSLYKSSLCMTNNCLKNQTQSRGKYLLDNFVEHITTSNWSKVPNGRWVAWFSYQYNDFMICLFKEKIGRKELFNCFHEIIPNGQLIFFEETWRASVWTQRFIISNAKKYFLDWLFGNVSNQGNSLLHRNYSTCPSNRQINRSNLTACAQ